MNASIISRLVIKDLLLWRKLILVFYGTSLAGIPILDVTEDAEALANDFTERGPLPKKAAIDALHIGVAAVHGMDYLLTWNCTHIANAAIRSLDYDLGKICEDLRRQQAEAANEVVTLPPKRLIKNDAA